MKVKIPTDKEWLKKRQRRWHDVWENSLRVVGISKQEKKREDETVAAQKIWYIEGDLSPILALPDDEYRFSAVNMKLVMRLCPATELEVYKCFLVDYSIILSELGISYWGGYKTDRNVSFYSSFFSLYSGEHSDSTEEIYAHMLSLLLPNEDGIVTFPLKLGKDQWQPTQEVALCDVARTISRGIGKYLFAEVEVFPYYRHLIRSLPYVKWIKDLNPQIFATTLLTNKPRPPALPPTPLRIVGASQELFRAFVGNILGYKSDLQDYNGPLRHNDLEVEQQLKELIDGLAMPKEYYDLIDFIHDHKDNYVDYSEE
jgi:hypothetical protein